MEDGQVSGVAFDSYWSAPNTDGTGESIVYRFGSVGQVFESVPILFIRLWVFYLCFACVFCGVKL